MKQSAFSFMLILLIEGICAIATYLKEKLMRNVNRGQDFGFGLNPDADFA